MPMDEARAPGSPFQSVRFTAQSGRVRLAAGRLLGKDGVHEIVADWMALLSSEGSEKVRE